MQIRTYCAQFLESIMIPDVISSNWFGSWSKIFRLLEVTECVLVPETHRLSLLITATDVLHS